MNYRKNEWQQEIKYKHMLIMIFSVFLLLSNLSTINGVDIPKINEITGDKDVINVINRTNGAKNIFNNTTDDNEDILQSTENSDDNNEKNSINFFPFSFKQKPNTLETESPQAKMGVYVDNIFVIAAESYVTALANKAIIVDLGDKTFSGYTDKYGIFTVSYKNADKYSISATFAGNSKNSGYSFRYTSNRDKHISNYAPNIDKSTSNSNSKINTDIQYPLTSTNMKNTGMALMEMFLSILCVLGLSIRKEYSIQ